MDWFCGFFKRQHKQVYEFHNQYNKQVVCNLNLARSSPEQVIGYFPSTDRNKANYQLVVQKTPQAYVEIKELKMGKGDNMIIRKMQKSNYEELIKQYSNSKKNWIDPDFPQQNNKTIHKWLRIHDILPKANFMSKHIEITPKMIMQGNLNNCYFLSAVAALAQRPYRIRNLFVSLETNPNGIYMCRMTFNGIFQQIVVDDYFPVNKDGQLAYAKAYQDTQFWPLILEKAWAKLFGSYEIINFGYNIESMYALTAAPALQFYMSFVQQNSDTSKRAFNQLLKADQENLILTASFQKLKNLEQRYRLQTGHAYTILSVFEVKSKDEKKMFLQLRNPYGSNSRIPNFKYNKNDPFWVGVSAQQKKRVNFQLIEKPNQGFFYIQWALYQAISDITSISQISDNANYLYDVVSIKNAQARYLSVQIESISTFHLLVAQRNQFRVKKFEDIKYATVLILIARMAVDSKGKRKHTYSSSMYYFSHNQTNYCSIPIHNAIPNSRYTIRVFMYGIEGQSTEITFGYYTVGNVGVKLLEGIDDEQFVNRTLLSKARELPLDNVKKKSIDNVGVDSWRVIQTITESNIGYIAYRIAVQTPPKKYKITVDVQEPNREQLYFLGAVSGKKAFSTIVGSGQEAIFVYTYKQYHYDPFQGNCMADTRPLPSSTIVAL